MTHHPTPGGESSDTIDVQRLYRAVADREPTVELLQMVFDMFGQRCDLRPPSAELRLASRVRAGGGIGHG